MNPSVRFEHVSKRYRMGLWLPSLRSALLDWRTARTTQYHWALQDVTFELQPGETLGIIGPNGAGKTTILKILSRVTTPTSGVVRTNGRLSALIELGAGFHPELTGRDNIYLNGTILGMRKSEIAARFDRIVAFAGIGDFLDTPVKRYSSGMYARLGFAVAAHVDPEVLLVDEVLAVGDTAFQAKCHARMDELRRNGTSVVFISHNMEAVRRVCDRGIVLHGGKAVFEGTVVEAIASYSDAVRRAARESSGQGNGRAGEPLITFDAEIEGVVLTDVDGRPTNIFPSGGKAVLQVTVHFNRAVHQPTFGMAAFASDGHRIYATASRWQNVSVPDFCAGERCRVEFALDLPILEGTYDLAVDVSPNLATVDNMNNMDRLERAASFYVTGPDERRADGLADLGATITVKRLATEGAPSPVAG